MDLDRRKSGSYKALREELKGSFRNFGVFLIGVTQSASLRNFFFFGKFENSTM